MIYLNSCPPALTCQITKGIGRSTIVGTHAFLDGSYYLITDFDPNKDGISILQSMCKGQGALFRVSALSNGTEVIVCPDLPPNQQGKLLLANVRPEQLEKNNILISSSLNENLAQLCWEAASGFFASSALEGLNCLTQRVILAFFEKAGLTTLSSRAFRGDLARQCGQAMEYVALGAMAGPILTSALILSKLVTPLAVKKIAKFAGCSASESAAIASVSSKVVDAFSATTTIATKGVVGFFGGLAGGYAGRAVARVVTDSFFPGKMN